MISQAAGCRLQWSCVSALRVGLYLGSLIPQQFLGPTRCFASCELQQCLTSRRFEALTSDINTLASRSSFGRGKILSASRGQYCCIDHFSSCLNCGSRLNPFLRCLASSCHPKPPHSPVTHRADVPETACNHGPQQTKRHEPPARLPTHGPVREAAPGGDQYSDVAESRRALRTDAASKPTRWISRPTPSTRLHKRGGRAPRRRRDDGRQRRPASPSSS